MKKLLSLALVLLTVLATAGFQETVSFTLDFRNPDGTPAGWGDYHSTGTFSLTGDKLSYSVALVGWFNSAEVLGPGRKAKPAFDLGTAQVAVHPPCNQVGCTPDFTSFEGERSLSQSQIVHLLHGDYYISINGGAVIGLILPLENDAHQAPGR